MDSLTKYEESTNTIRKVPENYCLIHWDNKGSVHFDMDGATKTYRNKVEEAHNIWFKNGSNNRFLLAMYVHYALADWNVKH